MINNYNKEILLGNYPRDVKEAALSVLSESVMNVTEPSILKTKCRFEKDEVSYLKYPKEIEDDYRIYWSESHNRKPDSRVIIIKATIHTTDSGEIVKDILGVSTTFAKYDRNGQFVVTNTSYKLYHRSALTRLIELSK